MFLYRYKVPRSKIWIYLFSIKKSLRIRYRLISDVLNSTFVMLKKISIRSIRTFIIMKILIWITKKTLMIVTIFKRNWFFLIDNMIYIMRTRKMHNFSKQIDVDKWQLLLFWCNSNSFNLFIYFLHCKRYDLAINFKIKLISTLFRLASFSFF